MRTSIGSTRYILGALVAAAAFTASTAFAQVSVQTGLNASVQAGDDHAGANASSEATADAPERASTTEVRADSRGIEARVNGEDMSQLHATTTARIHADDRSALMATGTAAAEATSTDEAGQGAPVIVQARFLGIFPVHLAVHETVDAQGNAKVSYPWYSFLFSLGAALDASAK